MNRALEPSTPHPQQSPRDANRVHVEADLLTQLQVCQKLGICDETWRRWRQAGQTPAGIPMPEQVQLSGRPRWRREDIDRLAGKPGAGRQFFTSVYRRRA